MAEKNDDDFLEAFALADDKPSSPAVIAARVLRDPHHAHLAENDITFLWLMRSAQEVKGNRMNLGRVHEVDVKGRLRDLFLQLVVERFGFMPHYIVTIDAQWWLDATPKQREALVWHELCHVKQAIGKDGEPRINKQTGEPVMCLVEHDIEEFNSTVAKYGLWKDDLKQFVAAAQSGPTDDDDEA